MYLNYAKLALNESGIPETPTLVLKTLGEKTIGVIPCVYNLKMNIKFSEPSEISFDIPAVIDGEQNWIYDELTGYKVIYTEHYGILPRIQTVLLKSSISKAIQSKNSLIPRSSS